MKYLRKNDGIGEIVDDEGKVIAKIATGDAGPEAFSEMEERLAQFLGDELPRVLLSMREGLLEDALADIECKIVILEDDRFALPALAVRQRDIILADPDAVTNALDGIAKRGAKYLE